MDIGIDGIMDRVEKTFGARAAKVLLGAIYMGIFAAALTAVWIFFSPIYNWLFTNYYASSGLWLLSKSISYILTLVLFWLLALTFANTLDAHRVLADAKEAQSESLDKVATAAEILGESRKLRNTVHVLWQRVGVEALQNPKLMEVITSAGFTVNKEGVIDLPDPDKEKPAEAGPAVDGS